MTSFADILKATGGTDKETRHSYGWVYDLWLAPLRDKEVKVLEAGVCEFGGGCVLSLAEYLPKAEIWAIDPNPQKCDQLVFDHEQIRFLAIDAYDERKMTEFIGINRFDAVIDDACHEIDRQISFLRFMIPYLAPKGFHIIEDCVTDQWIPHFPSLRDMGLRYTLIDTSTEEVPDNAIIKWEKHHA